MYFDLNGLRCQNEHLLRSAYETMRFPLVPYIYLFRSFSQRNRSVRHTTFSLFPRVTLFLLSWSFVLVFFCAALVSFSNHPRWMLYNAIVIAREYTNCVVIWSDLWLSDMYMVNVSYVHFLVICLPHLSVPTRSIIHSSRFRRFVFIATFIFSSLPHPPRN